MFLWLVGLAESNLYRCVQILFAIHTRITYSQYCTRFLWSVRMNVFKMIVTNFIKLGLLLSTIIPYEW